MPFEVRRHLVNMRRLATAHEPSRMGQVSWWRSRLRWSSAESRPPFGAIREELP
jgi:hypothetical protein